MVNAPEPILSPAQVRAARAWLDWNQDTLAKKAKVSKTTLNRFEQGLSLLNSNTSVRIRKVLEEAGIRFQFKKMLAIGISIVSLADE